MWVKLFRAEIYKIVGNRWATGCMIWIFPILAVFLMGFFLLLVALSSDAREGMAEEPMLWTDNMIGVWNIPNNPLGRLLLLGFTAILFGGEYQWNTWKSIVPRSWRVPLIITKFVAVAVFVVFAFILMSILWTLGGWVVMMAAGVDYGPDMTGEVLSNFVEDYALQMATTFISVIIAAGVAALAAMITRSILGSVIVGFVVTIAEGFSLIGLALLGWLLGYEDILNAYRITPTYNLLNVFSWINDHTATTFEISEQNVVSDSLAFSMVILVGWVIGLIALTAFLFQRQDITN